MFTGIIEELGHIKSIVKQAQGVRLEIEADLVLQDVKVGDSISVNGCCLTVVQHDQTSWICDVVHETILRTCLQELHVGDPVNLERAVKLQDRLGGHLVQGHVDETGIIDSKVAYEDGSWWVTIRSSPAILRYMVYKGSIAVDGVSLTIAEVKEESFSFAMIPHTAKMTSLGFKGPNALVNLEVDLMAKYVERLLYPLKGQIHDKQDN